VLLTVEGLRVAYGAIEALHGISLRVGQGQIVTLIGANGAGKTTLLRCVSGLIRPTSGRVTFDGLEITGMPPHALVRLGIVQAPEGRRIFGPLTVWENLLLGGYLYAWNSETARRLQLVFRLFPALKARLTQRGGTLSGGEQQMLAIARALMARPRLLLLDEPSTGLAPVLVRQIFQHIGHIRGEGVTVLLVEQNARQALRLADYAYVMERGTIVLEGPGRVLLADRAVQSTYLGITA
jgi:branched-chain amino acid transport system ATP-binding protein